MVKVADFGVARVQAQSGVMTAETGTYRWMAPEVCLLLLTITLKCGNGTSSLYDFLIGWEHPMIFSLASLTRVFLNEGHRTQTI